MAQLTPLRLIRTANLAIGADGQKIEDFPLQTANPDVAPSALPANGTISSLTFSATPTQAEVEALRDECENLRDALTEVISQFNTFKDRLAESGDVPLFED